MNKLIPVFEITVVKVLVVEFICHTRLKKLDIFLSNNQGFWFSCHNKRVRNLTQLYDHFVDKFNKAVEEFGRARMSAELNKLQKLNDEVRETCVVDIADNSKLTGNYRLYLSMNLGYVINPQNEEYCKNFASSEPYFALEIYDRQKTILGL